MARLLQPPPSMTLPARLYACCALLHCPASHADFISPVATLTLHENTCYRWSATVTYTATGMGRCLHL